MGAAVVVVAVEAGAERGGSATEPGGRAGEADRGVGAGVAAVVAGHTGLVHAVVEVAHTTDAVLVDSVEKALVGTVAGSTVVGVQAR